MSQKAVVSEGTQRYETVALAIEWMNIMQHMDEYKDLSRSELVKKAADDVIQKLVTESDIAKHRKAAPVQPAPVEKAVPVEPVVEEEEEPVKPKKKK